MLSLFLSGIHHTHVFPLLCPFLTILQHTYVVSRLCPASRCRRQSRVVVVVAVVVLVVVVAKSSQSSSTPSSLCSPSLSSVPVRTKRCQLSTLPDRAAPATLQDGAASDALQHGVAPATLQDGAASASRQHDTRNPLSRLTTTLDTVALAGRECSEAAGCRMDGEAPASSKQDGEATACSGINDPLASPRCLFVHRFFQWRGAALMYLYIGDAKR